MSRPITEAEYESALTRITQLRSLLRALVDPEPQRDQRCTGCGQYVLAHEPDCIVVEARHELGLISVVRQDRVPK